MNRCCHLLSDGEAEISCALLYDAEAHWMQTDFTPLEDCAKALYDHQIDYDIVPQDVLMELKGKYSLLIVPWPGCLMPHLEEKLQASGLRFVYAAKKARIRAAVRRFSWKIFRPILRSLVSGMSYATARFRR